MMQEWFLDAKLGIFVHWGIYAVNGMGGESWPIASGSISYNDYLKQMDKFNPTKFDPDAWASLFTEIGAKYAVLTTKHHDGVTLWPTKEDSPCIPKDSPYKKDIVGAFREATRRHGLKTGLYFSHTDWSNKDHMQVLLNCDEETLERLRRQKTVYRELWGMATDKDDTEREANKKKWNQFLRFHRAQLTELLTNYHPDLVWFDVMLHRTGYEYPTAEIRDFIHSVNDKTVINSRLGSHGDYQTPEQGIPIVRPEGPWEFCVTLGHTWSYVENQRYKSPYQVITMFCEVLGMGGNMLLNVGPAPDGTIDERDVAILREFGKWVNRNREAVYGTVQGLPHGHVYSPSSMNKEKNTIYIYWLHEPKDGAISVKGIRNEIRRVTILGDEEELSTKRVGGAAWARIPGVLWIDLPREKLDEHVTVIKIELDGELDLFHSRGKEIDAN